ncbi:MAG: hypothetical protein JST06_09000 [Bacteroidetes bacterium]|nr:hypothetical protein [Bacteroidota bacterium]MBS1629320.1 hypothetical protein [Bacteroidota bacterium]
MKTSINSARLNSMLRGIQKSIELFQTQGHDAVYFTAQFMRGKQKQNSIERGDVASFATLIRTYAKSEDADSVRIEFFDEATDKSFYSKVLTELQSPESEKSGSAEKPSGFNGFGGVNGLGEAEFNALVDKRVEVKEQAKDYARQTKELEELRIKYAALEEEKAEIEAALEAKKKVEYYSGIISSVVPSIAPLFQGTPLAQAAGMLAGIGGAAKAEADSPDEDVNALAEMVTDFCKTLSPQEASAFHLLCAGLEKDRNKIYSFLRQLMAEAPAN